MVTQSQDYWPTNEWRNATPEDQGMDSSYLEKMYDFYTERQWLLRSIMVVRNGYIVFEDYPVWRAVSAYPPYSIHPMWGCSDFVTLGLTGIAIENGNISGVNELVFEHFTDWIIANPDARKDNITIDHLLTYTSGMDWDDDIDFSEMRYGEDSVQYILDRPMVETPGEVWNPNSGGVHLISSILNETTGILPSDYANASLFQPLGIQEFDWETDPQGLPWGTCGIGLKPRDMAKLWLLYLNNGTWDGEQLIPAEWHWNTTEIHVESVEKYSKVGDFGYIWWLNRTYGAYHFANPESHYGATVWIIPKHDLIFTATYANEYEFVNLIRNFILPAVGVTDFMDPEPSTTITTPTSTTSSTPTSPATTTTTEPNGLPQNKVPLLIGLGVAIVVVLVVYIMKKRQ
jgi:hypothetical protein